MIQFNLLPDVKKEYVKAKRTKRLIMSSSMLASIGVVGVTVLMFTFVHVAQKKHINDLSKDIARVTGEIQSTEDLNDILTVQNQLSILPSLHETKPETSRLFDYLSFVSPQQIRVASIDLDTKLASMKISGSADSIATVNKFVDNFKSVKYSISGNDQTSPVYSNVVTELSGNNDKADFTVKMTYDSMIFNNTQDIVMKLGTATTAPVSEPGGGQ